MKNGCGKEHWKDGSSGSWIEREPYRTLFAQLNGILQNANLLLVIGYSFHDDEVNRTVLDWVNKDESRQVLVVDPGVERGQPPFEWLKISESNCRWSRFEWLQARFGDKDTSVELIKAIRKIRFSTR